MTNPDWIPATTSPPDGTVVEVMTPGGDVRNLAFGNGMWWLPDRSMYVYFVPLWWRPIEESHV